MPNASVCISDMVYEAVGHVAAERNVTETYAAKGCKINEWSTEQCAMDEQTMGCIESSSSKMVSESVNGCWWGRSVTFQFELVCEVVNTGGLW